jgi:hypothetical protein
MQIQGDEYEAKRLLKILFIGGVLFIVGPLIILEIFGDIDLRCILLPAWGIGFILAVRYIQLLTKIRKKKTE